MRRKPPKYRKRGNVIELPFSKPPVPEPELTLALVIVHVERKMKSDEYFDEFTAAAIEALAESIAAKALEVRKKDPQKPMDEITSGLIEDFKKKFDQGAEACAERAWERISRSARKPSENVPSLDEMMEAIGRDTLSKEDSRKTWLIEVPSERTKEAVLEALRAGRYQISVTERKVVIRPEFE